MVTRSRAARSAGGQAKPTKPKRGAHARRGDDSGESKIKPPDAALLASTDSKIKPPDHR